MKRAKKRYVIHFENINGKGKYGQFTKREKAEYEIEMNQLRDNNDIAQGYANLQNKYWIEEIVIY